jgi:hypothetical protein
MAEVKTIKINVDTKQAVNAMDDLAKATHDVSASFEEVYGDIQPLTARMGEAEDRLYELAAAGKTTTQEYKDLLKTVGDYRKVQIQTDMAVDAAATNMGQKLGGALGGVTAGFSLAQGAMGAFGVESEELEKVLLRVQAALAIQQGVQGIREAIPSFKALGTAAKNALAGIKAGIAATGIGLLVVALGTLVAYWDDIKSAVSGVSDEQTKLNEKTDANVLAQQAKYDTISGQDNILKLQGKSEQDILKIKKAQINAVITATEAQLVQQESTKKAQVAAAKRNNEILQGIITFLTAPLQLLLKTVDMVGSALGKDFGLQKGFTKGLANLVFDPEETAAEADKTIEETKKKLASLKNEAAGFQLALNDIGKPATNAVKASASKTVESAIQMVDAFDKAAIDINEIDNQLYEDMRARDAKELAEIEANNAELIDTELRVQQALTDAAKQGATDRVNAALAEQQQKEAIQKQNIDFALQGIAIVKGLFEQNKNVQKAAIIAESALGIAKMIISNKTANLGALATPQAIATSGLSAAPVIAANNISTGLGIAANIAATGKALKALGGGSVSPPPSTGGGGSAGGQAPSFNVVGNSGINQLAQLQQQPMQAYVVSGSVTTAQSLDRNRIENATL